MHTKREEASCETRTKNKTASGTAAVDQLEL